MGGVWAGYPIFAPSQLKEINFDKIIILSEKYYEDIYETLVYWFHVDPDKIQKRTYWLKLLFMDKYRDTDDNDIKNILKYWKDHELSVFNQYVEMGKEIREVYWDNIENMPYIMFEDKKMYYPYDYQFTEVEGRKVLIDLMSEQQPSSPHLYITDNIKVEHGDVVADAGVCEGNFALRYVEKASKMYLFESDPKWIKPLKKTFEKFKSKVIICEGLLGRGDVTGIEAVEKYVSLDTVVKGRLDFLKMDIEGAEVEALIGGRRTLMNNDVKCAICSYHRMRDEFAISDLLKSYGYKTSHSDGYMVLHWDWDVWLNLEFRRGIVYGTR